MVRTNVSGRFRSLRRPESCSEWSLKPSGAARRDSYEIGSGRLVSAGTRGAESARSVCSLEVVHERWITHLTRSVGFQALVDEVYAIGHASSVAFSTKAPKKQGGYAPMGRWFCRALQRGRRRIGASLNYRSWRDRR